jgi:hypothetical protein
MYPQVRGKEGIKKGAAEKTIDPAIPKQAY